MAKHANASGPQLNSLSDEEESSPVEKGSPRVEEDQAQTDEHKADEHLDDGAETPGQQRLWSVQSALTLGVAVVVALGCLAGWLSYCTYESRLAQAQRNQLVAAARQGALNLTTIDYTEVDAAVQRILDSSTGTFHDDFQMRAQPFLQVVKKVQSKSQGTVTAAGLESQDGNQAQVLVAVTVKTSTAGAPEQDPRRWRMRIGVQKVGNSAKISNVQFVP